MPVTLLLDGEADTDDFDAYGVQVLRSRDIRPTKLAHLSFGSLRAKLATLWASPYETFLVLDADTVVWGDVRELADFERFDFVLDSRMSEPVSSVMEVARVEEHVRGFDASRHVADYVNTGAFFGRRGLVDLGRYEHLLRLSESHPGMFRYGDQGLFNTLVFQLVDEGGARVDHVELQVKSGRTSRAELARRFTFTAGRPAVVERPVVLHWVGSPKPRVHERAEDYFGPMTYFRLEHRRRARDGAPRLIRDRLWLRVEDARCGDLRGRSLRGRAARLRRRAGQRWRESRSSLRQAAPEPAIRAVRRLRGLVRRSSP